ncbi:hypothetical protein F5Y15DRAFT_430248 [Xylariaceae sp. FL0016]|nr:hypothetical protein F5Y15DRAFT_430248 [Xylariaceae sp. FL0016]
MSGRSAYVRKKITEPKTGGEGSGVASRGCAKSSGSGRYSEHDDAPASEYPLPQGTGYGTTNGRFLKFSDPVREVETPTFRKEITNLGNNSGGSQSGSDSGRRDAISPLGQGPMPDFAYARARKPVLRTEDVSGIERSGFRSAVDKKSDGFRKGISKAFAFGGKKKKEDDMAIRSPSSATIRPYEYGEQLGSTSRMPPMPTDSTQTLTWDPEYQQMISPPPSAKLPPLPAPTGLPPIKRWMGARRPVQKWNKLRKDPELWDPNGDVLIYFGRKDQPQRPNPSFRLSSHIIEATESRFLVTLLREGSTEDDYGMQIHMPPSPVGEPPMVRESVHRELSYLHAKNSQPTPPMSEDTSLAADNDGQISYEMYFQAPPNLSKLDAHRHAITTRNVFALLYHASLVGLSLFQALADLLDRLESYMPPEADNVGTILNYLSARGIDDSRNDAESAVSMLAWSETPGVRWEEGWREAFLHCAGMYSRLEGCADFKHLTPITRALLERACLETQLRVQAAEERLSDFAYGDIWPSSGPIAHGPARAAADRLQRFFVSHYAKKYGSWPPAEEHGATTTEGEEMWLTRVMARSLQKDFGALYDYLVNRDIVWDESETRSSRKWMMVSETGNKSFSADTSDLPLTDMLIEYDNRMRFPHVPHPYPLVPESIPPTASPGSGGNNNSGRDRSKRDRNPRSGGGGNDDRILERRIQLAYTEATNIYTLGSEFTASDLVDSFVRFEKTDLIGSLDPFPARRGRWVLIYGVLQTLASVSVDSPAVRYRDDDDNSVAYHLSPRLKGTRTPPWRGVATPTPEASHELSHCWIAPRTWYHSGGESAAESDTSAGGGHDPVMRVMRSQQRLTRFLPAAPPSSSARSAAGSHTGWYTPTTATRSLRSSGTGTTAPSIMSGVSDDNNSSSSSRFQLPFHPSHLPSSSAHRAPATAKSERSTATFGPASGRVDDAQWPTRRESRRQILPPLDLPSAEIEKGGFLDISGSSSTGSPDEQGDQRKGGPDAGGGTVKIPLIRDFDELDSVAEEHGYGFS